MFGGWRIHDEEVESYPVIGLPIGWGSKYDRLLEKLKEYNKRNANSSVISGGKRPYAYYYGTGSLKFRRPRPKYTFFDSARNTWWDLATIQYNYTQQFNADYWLETLLHDMPQMPVDVTFWLTQILYYNHGPLHERIRSELRLKLIRRGRLEKWAIEWINTVLVAGIEQYPPYTHGGEVEYEK